MPGGFGRLSLSFDEPVPMRARVSNGVLVVAFGGSVKVDVEKIARELPEYISIARVDPDGRGMRFGLARPYRANVIEAGDKAFIDLLPANWRGVLPGPPQEVVAALAERLRLAEARAREAAGRPPEKPPALTLRSASLPTADRLLFEAPAGTALKTEAVDGMLRLDFDRALTLDPPALRQALPEGVTLVSQENGDDATSLILSVPKDSRIRNFRDDDGLVVDLVRPEKPNQPAAVSLQQPPQAPPTAQAANGAAPAPAGAAPAPPAAAPAPPPPEPPPGPVRIAAADARLDFRFPRRTGAAAFLDAGIVTLVFDTRDTIDPAEMAGLLPGLIRDATVSREGKITLVRLRPVSQQLARFFDDGTTWSLSFADQAGSPAAAVAPRRTVDERGQTILAVPLPGLTGIHWLEPGPSGVAMAVATATGPAHLTAKPFDFVELGLLQTAHGVVVMPRSDDLVVRAGTEEVRIDRGAGLNVTLDAGATQARAEPREASRQPLIDTELWGKLRLGSVREGARTLLRDVTDTSRARKSQARLALARFYVANGLMPEASGPLNALLADDPSMRASREALFLKAVIASEMRRDREAMAAFDAEPIRDDTEARLWRALVDERSGRDAQALVGFRQAEDIIARYPPDLQGTFRSAMARAALDMKDLGVAEREVEALSEMPRDDVDQEVLALLRARLDDSGGRPDAAMNGYRPLFEARSRPVAAEAQLRAVRLARAEKRTDISSDEALARLETVAITWRGGDLEIEALAELGSLYADGQRWRDAFQVARRANENFPDHALTRRLHDETARRFAELFGSGGGKLPRIDALALFYDFKEFLPIGRRGDEITRLLADRLVELDLLDQAAEILRYQMERRMSGAARSTVAARLAMIELMNGKPADALRALATTRLVELPSDVRRARLLLEAKALSDLSRTEQALELLEGERGPEVDRLRADIYWTGRRWREAGEAHERLLGDSWRGEDQLSDSQRGDAMRTAVSYVMAGEALQLERLRGKFAAKMARSSDARTFAFITGGASRTSSADIREMARATAGSGSLSDFMSAYRERYPAIAPALRQPRPAAPAAQPSGEASTATEPAARG